MNALALGLSAVIALAAALLAWALIDIGAGAVARHRLAFTRNARLNLRELFLFVDPTKLYALNIGAMLLGAALAWIVSGSWLLALVVLLVLGAAPALVFRHLRARRLARFEAQLPDALMMLAGGLRAGVSLTVAIQQLVREAQPPLAQEFDLMLREQRLGVTLDTALANLERRLPMQSVTLTVSAMRIAHETGGGLAETLERTAATLRGKLALEGKIRALTAQGKLQALVVGALPLLLIAVLTRLLPAEMSLLWTTRIGWATLALIAILEFIGVYLIRRIVAIDV